MSARPGGGSATQRHEQELRIADDHMTIFCAGG